MTTIGRINRDEGPDTIRVDRTTKWGNPFKISPSMTRSQAIAEFMEWVKAPAQRRLREQARIELRGKRLLCWCKPLPCHASIWAQIADSKNDGELRL